MDNVMKIAKSGYGDNYGRKAFGKKTVRRLRRRLGRDEIRAALKSIVQGV